MIEIANAIRGHKHLRELSLANQRSALSTSALQAMVDAMETVPSLVQLNLGNVRDAGMRWRLQSITTANVERNRQQRWRASSTASVDGGAPPPMKPRRASLPSPPPHCLLLLAASPPGSTPRCRFDRAVQLCISCASRSQACAPDILLARTTRPTRPTAHCCLH